MFEGASNPSSILNPTEALVWQKDMVNKRNNNVKDGHSTHKQKAPTPLDLSQVVEAEDESYWGEVEEEESKGEMRANKRGGGNMGEEEEEEGRKRQRRSPPVAQGSLPSLPPLFTENRFDQQLPPSENSTTPPYSSVNSVTPSSYSSSTRSLYSPPYPAPTFTLTPPLTPNTPQNTFTFSFPPSASQSLPYSTDNPTPVADEHRFMRKILPKPLEIPTNTTDGDSFQPYSVPPGFGYPPLAYPSDPLPPHSVQKFQYPQKQEPTLYYNPPLQQANQQALRYHHQQQQQHLVHQGGGGGYHQHQQKPKQPRPNFSQNQMARQTSTPPLVGASLNSFHLIEQIQSPSVCL